MRNLAIAAYSLTGTVYLLFFLWLIIQGKTKEISQRYFLVWLLFLTALGINGTIFTSVGADDALMFYRAHFAILIASGVALLFFTISLHRELTERDLIYTFPALVMMPLIWTTLTKGVNATPYGWEIVFNGYWFAVYFVAMYAYYFGAIFHLYKVLLMLRKVGTKAAMVRVRILLGSVIFLTLAGFLTPIGRALSLHFMPALLSLLYTFPAGFMAYSFRLPE